MHTNEEGDGDGELEDGVVDDVSYPDDDEEIDDSDDNNDSSDDEWESHVIYIHSKMQGLRITVG